MPLATHCEICGRLTENLLGLCDDCQRKADEEDREIQRKLKELEQKPIRPTDVFPVYKKG